MKIVIAASDKEVKEKRNGGVESLVETRKVRVGQTLASKYCFDISACEIAKGSRG